MPLKPENRKRYPSNWKWVRAMILARANNCCEDCGVENYALIHRYKADPKVFVYTEAGDGWNPIIWRDPVKVILTVAHLEGPIENCNVENLRALCARCHLKYDQRRNIAQRRVTLARKRGQLNLIEVPVETF